MEFSGSCASGRVWAQWSLAAPRVAQRHLLRAAHRMPVALLAQKLPALDKCLLVLSTLERQRGCPLGGWDKVVEALRVEVRYAQGRKAVPTAAVIDTQSVKTTEKGGLVALTEPNESADAKG